MGYSHLILLTWVATAPVDNHSKGEVENKPDEEGDSHVAGGGASEGYSHDAGEGMPEGNSHAAGGEAREEDTQAADSHVNDHVVSDPSRPLFLHLKPDEASWLPSSDKIKSVRGRIENYRDWEFLTGGREERWYAPNLDDAYLTGFMDCLLDHVKSEYYPSFQGKHLKVGAMKTAPNSGSQYEQHGQRLHSDYRPSLQNVPESEQPMSAILSLDDFILFHLPEGKSNKNEVQELHVKSGELVVFKCGFLHSGGPHPGGEKESFRLFAYMAFLDADIQKKVELYSWDESGCIIKKNAEESDERKRSKRRLGNGKLI